MTRELDGYPYHIVYNGEIYNIKELKNDLASHQVFPKTNSDTEILLLSYLTFGADFVKKSTVFLPLPFMMNGTTH